MKSSLASVLISRTTRVAALFFSVSAIAMGGFFISQAHATPTTVVINEFMSNPSSGSEWVELYNPTNTNVNANTLTLTELTNPSTATPTETDLPALSGTVPAHGFLAVDVSGLNNAGDSIGLYMGSSTSGTPLDRVTYGNVSDTTKYPITTGLTTAPASGQSAYRTTDGGDTWAVGSPTKGITNVPAPTVVNISNVTELRYAIEHQVDGQTWNIAAGNYGLAAFNDITTQGETGWYFPITVNNLTIKGTGNPVIYGTGYTTNGNWSTQNLISIFGNNVTIDGVTLMPKVEPNKTIEVLGSNTTIKNVTIEPNTLTDQSEYASIPNAQDRADELHWGGSIYFNNATGTQTLENVTIQNGGISDHAPSATLNLTNVNLNYSTSVDWINAYRLATHGHTVNGTAKVVYHVDSTLNNIDSVIANLQKGDTIMLDSNITTDKQITIAQDDVTLDGNGHTISPSFSKTDNSNNSALGIDSNGVTVNNLIVDGTGGTNLHGINTYLADGVNLNNVTVKNNDHDGLVVNGSKVTVNNLTTSNNGWGGVDVDQGSGVTAPSVLTINGQSTHSEAFADIYVDDTTKAVSVVDTNNQYTITTPVVSAHDAVYSLIPAPPTGLYLSFGDSTTHYTNGETTHLQAGGGAWHLNWTNTAATSSITGYMISRQYPNATTTSQYTVLPGSKPTPLYDFTQKGTGTYTYMVKIRDANMQWLGYSDPITVTYTTATTGTNDPTPPAVPTNLRFTHQGTTYQSGYTTNTQVIGGGWHLDWDTSLATSSVKAYYIERTYPNGATSHYTVLPGSKPTPLYDFTQKGTGTYTYRVKVEDTNGNWSDISDPATITYSTTSTPPDTTVPAVEITSAIQSPVNAVSFDGSISDNDLNYYYCYLTTDQTVTVGNATYTPGQEVSNTRNSSCVTTWAKGQNSFTGTLGGFDVTGLPSGNYTINLVARDIAGNSNASAPATYSITINHPVVTTNVATNITSSDATLNGTNGLLAGTGHSFWVSTSTIDTSSSNIPKGVYSTPDMGAIGANATSSALLSLVTTDGIPSNMPVITANTTYYFVAWSYVNGQWYHGAVQSFSTQALPKVITNPATAITMTGGTLHGTNGSTAAGNTSFWWGTTNPSSPITSSSQFSSLSGWYHDNGLGPVAAGVPFSEMLTNLQMNTAYHFVAWSQIGGVWYPGSVLDFTTLALPNVTTDLATAITPTNATLNGTVGSLNADQESFWVSTSTFDTSSPIIPANVWSTPVLSPVASSTTFSDPLSIVTTNGITTGNVDSNMPAITTGTTYYYAAWAHVGGTWYPGAVRSFVTGLSAPMITSPTDGSATTTAGLQQVSWTAVNGSGITYVYQSALSTTTTTTGAFTYPAYTSSPLATTYISTAGTPAGTYYLHVMAKDSNGNESAWSPVVQVHVFTTMPIAYSYTYATTTVEYTDLATSLSDAIANPSKWFFWDDNTNNINNSLGAFIVGPATAPLGDGSAEISAPMGTRIALASGALAGTALKDISSLSYSTYRTVGTPDLDLSLQFDVNSTGTGMPVSYEGRLVYEPYFTHTVADNTWQTWNPMDNSTVSGHGNWWFSNGDLSNVSRCSQSNPCTWDQVLAAYPNIGISAGTYFKAGQWNSNFAGTVDKFVVGIKSGSNIHTTTYDFEPTPVTENTSTGGGAGGILGDLNNDGKVDFRDFALFMFALDSHGTNLSADFNHDGVVNLADLSILMGNWTN